MVKLEEEHCSVCSAASCARSDGSSGRVPGSVCVSSVAICILPDGPMQVVQVRILVSMELGNCSLIPTVWTSSFYPGLVVSVVGFANLQNFIEMSYLNHSYCKLR